MMDKAFLVACMLAVLSGVMFYLGYLTCDINAKNKPKKRKAKPLEELADKELFALHVAIFNEISRRGAALIEPFEEFKKK